MSISDKETIERAIIAVAKTSREKLEQLKLPDIDAVREKLRDARQTVSILESCERFLSVVKRKQNQTIDFAALPARAVTLLRSLNVKTIPELAALKIEDLKKSRENCGKITLQALQSYLKANGLCFSDEGV